MVTPSTEHHIVIPFDMEGNNEGDEIEVLLDGDVYIGTIHHSFPLSEDKIGISLVLKQG